MEQKVVEPGLCEQYSHNVGGPVGTDNQKATRPTHITNTMVVKNMTPLMRLCIENLFL